MEQPPKNLFDLEALSKEVTSDFSEPIFTDEPDDSKIGEKYLVFKIDEENYAIPSERVAEVVKMLPLTELPNLPSWFLGIANLRGAILSIIDLPGTWNAECSIPSQKAKLIVLRSENSDSNLAFRVDRLREITILEDGEIIEPKSDKESHLVGTADYKSLKLNVLSIPDILTSLALR